MAGFFEQLFKKKPAKKIKRKSTATRKRRADEETMLLEWSPDQDKKKRTKKKSQNLTTIVSLGAGVILLGAFVGYVTLKEPVKSKRVVREDPFKNIGKPKARPKKVVEVKQEAVPDEVRILSEDIVEIAPTVYKSVEVEIERLPQTARRKINFIIKGLVISVISKTWNKLTGSNKVDLLNRTFALLNVRYPGITPFVTLKFDDKRRDLDLKFDDFVKRGNANLSKPMHQMPLPQKEQTVNNAG